MKHKSRYLKYSENLDIIILLNTSLDFFYPMIDNDWWQLKCTDTFCFLELRNIRSGIIVVIEFKFKLLTIIYNLLYNLTIFFYAKTRKFQICLLCAWQTSLMCKFTYIHTQWDSDLHISNKITALQLIK